MAKSQSQSDSVGIASLGLQLPPLAMRVEELAELRNEDPNKYKIGLGCDEIALCPKDYGVVELAAGAARRALSRWSGSLEDIGLLAVGTESALDMSRPLSAWVADALGLKGSVRSYEVKHACYGGTLALRQAVEWQRSGASRGKAALVIASDISLYALRDPGEPTQGAGAVAMIVGAPDIAEVEPISYASSEPAFDFWRPVGQDYPSVDGPLSLECYQRAAVACFKDFIAERDALQTLSELSALCFHVPFPKMVKKAVQRMGEVMEIDAQQIGTLFEQKIAPTMAWNRKCGNAYTASLWVSVASALCERKQGERLAAFSYGSGFGAELLMLRAGAKAQEAAWRQDIESDLAERQLISIDAYKQLRGE